MKKIVLPLIFLFSIVSAKTDVSPLPSLSWQKQSLEEKIRGKVEDVLQVVTHSNLFSVDVEIIHNDPEIPEFDKSVNPKEEEGGVDAVASKKVTTTEQEQKEAEEKQKEKQKKSNALIKFSDEEPGADVEDVVVFSKFGMEAPLIEDFNDFRPDGKIILSMSNNEDKRQLEALKADFEKEEKRLQQQIEEYKRRGRAKPTVVEQMWRYNNSVDIFKNLTGVKILVRLSDAMKKDMRVKVENQVKKLNFNLGTVKPKIKFEYSIYTPKEKQEVPSEYENLLKIIDYISKFSDVIAIVLGCILIGLVGNGLVNKYFALNTGVTNTGNFKMEGDQGSSEDEKDAMELAGGGPGGPGGELGALGLNGIERFKVYAETTPKEAMLLIKKWIALNDKQSSAALRALVQQVDNASLMGLFDRLSERDRDAWKGLLDKPLSNNELAIANDFISNQIVQSVIVPSLIDDPETYDLMLKIKPESIVEIYENEPQTAALIINSLNENFIGEVLGDCDQNIIEGVIKNAINVTPEDIRNGQDQIKNALVKYVEDSDRKPFVNKLVTILPTAKPEVEAHIYDSLVHHMGYAEFREVASSAFPAELVRELPENFLKATLSAYPLKKKIKMLLAIDEEMRTYFLSIFAPEGTKASDLVQIEFESYEKDEEAMKLIENESSALWKDFVDYTRDAIKADKQFKYEIDEILNEWCDNKVQNGGTHLRAVA